MEEEEEEERWTDGCDSAKSSAWVASRRSGRRCVRTMGTERVAFQSNSLLGLSLPLTEIGIQKKQAAIHRRAPLQLPLVIAIGPLHRARLARDAGNFSASKEAAQPQCSPNAPFGVEEQAVH